MTKFYNIISSILHPVLLPLVATVFYLFKLPLFLTSPQKQMIIVMVLIATFVVPILTFLILKGVGYIKTYKAGTIEERKLPVLLMIVNYLFLAQILKEIFMLRELIILVYATAIGLIITSLMFYARIKVSLHMLGMSGLVSFVLLCGHKYLYSHWLIAVLIILMGLLATARLQLKAHTMKEVVIGTTFGLLIPGVLSYIM